jgi:AcrR family transcriptional regulator
MSRRGRPPAADSEETRQRLLRAARERFGESGYARASMADIAHEAGVTPRAIYYYFSSKADLFQQATAAAYDRFTAEIVERVLVHDDIRTRLHGFVDVFRVLFREDRGLVAFLSLAPFEAHRNPELPGARQLTGELPDINELLVREAVAEGALADGVDAGGAVALLEVFGAGLTLLATGDRQDDYLAMLDVVDRFVDGALFVD